MTDHNFVFAGVEGEQNKLENASIILQSIPYDGTSTWGKGADRGFHAFLDASKHMETYDIETDSEVIHEGIHIPKPITEKSTPEAVFQRVYSETQKLLKTNKFLTFFGGEHSISIGILKAFYEMNPNMTILQLDAHTDLRAEYEGSPYNHACAVHEASKHSNLVQVGIRSMDRSELPYLHRNQCYFAENMHDTTEWMEDSISKMTEKIYITLDLDVLDPSVMPSTGTPEPGGLDWNTVIQYLRKVFQQKEVIGFDIVELAPIEGLNGPNFLAAKLYYKMLSYKFVNS